jgi:hypothetical protein
MGTKNETYFDCSAIESATRRGRPHVRQTKWPCGCGSMRLLRHESAVHWGTEKNRLLEKMKYSWDTALQLVGAPAQLRPSLSSEV